MATRKRSRKPATTPDEDEVVLSEEEAEAMAGAPADGENELPPLDVENLTPVSPFPEVSDEPLRRPFGQETLGVEFEEELHPMGVRDDSVNKARDAASIMREANASLLLHRVEPSEYRGHRTRGYIKRFHAPFSVEEAQVWAAENRGGGKYRYWIYDGGGTIRGGSTFEIAGNPKTPEEIAQAQNEAAAKAKAGSGDSDRERERDLERQLADERMDRFMQMMAQQRREDQIENRRMMEKIVDAQNNRRGGADEWAPLIAALSPILVKVLEKPEPPPPPPDHFKELAVLQERFQTEMMRLNRDQLEKAGKPDRTEMMMNKMMEAMMQKSLGIGQHDPMSGINMALDKVLPTLVSKITNIAIDKAAGGDKEEEKDLSPRFIAEKVADVVKDATEKFANRGQPQGPPPGYGYGPGAPMPMLPPGAMPGQPSAPVEGWPLTGPPEDGVLPEQQMAHEAMQDNEQVIEIRPGETYNGITNNGPTSLFVPAVPDPVQTPAPTATPAPVQPSTTDAPSPDAVPVTPTAPAPEVEQPPHVHPEVFQKAIEFLQSGQNGEDLAIWVDDNNQGNRLLSKVAIEYLENTAPFYLVGYIIEAAPPELASHFTNPHAKQLVSDFCDWYYNAEDAPEGEEPDAPATPEPTPEVPSE